MTFSVQRWWRSYSGPWRHADSLDRCQRFGEKILSTFWDNFYYKRWMWREVGHDCSGGKDSKGVRHTPGEADEKHKISQKGLNSIKIVQTVATEGWVGLLCCINIVTVFIRSTATAFDVIPNAKQRSNSENLNDIAFYASLCSKRKNVRWRQ